MKTRMSFWFMLVVLTAMVSACATAGRQFDRKHIDDIRKGVQTKEVIREWFGKPYQIAKPLAANPAGCVERWTYVHAYASHGGARTKSAALVVDFDRNGKVCDHAYTEQN